MKYFFIAGEASGDLHAACLMRAIKAHDAAAEFRFVGGDLMAAEAGEPLIHYRHLAYMGFIPVLLHLPTILGGMRQCRRAIASWRPDAVVLVDYPGFNLGMAEYVKREGLCPVYYYIAPKIWAWKEYRIKAIRRDVDRLFSILPFEVDFFEHKHHYPISYVGNPTVDEVAVFRSSYAESYEQFAQSHGLSLASRPVALLAGSRRQEIAANLPRMIRAVCSLPSAPRNLVIAAAPSVPQAFYVEVLRKCGVDVPAAVKAPDGQTLLFSLPQQGTCPAGVAPFRLALLPSATYPLLSHAVAALVTSGTATLETALFQVPQVVCYHVGFGKVVSLLRRLFLKVPFISLVNLVCGREVVPELVADGMTAKNVARHLAAILPGGDARDAQLEGYADMDRRLGQPGAPERAAREMVQLLRQKDL